MSNLKSTSNRKSASSSKGAAPARFSGSRRSLPVFFWTQRAWGDTGRAGRSIQKFFQVFAFCGRPFCWCSVVKYYRFNHFHHNIAVAGGSGRQPVNSFIGQDEISKILVDLGIDCDSSALEYNNGFQVEGIKLFFQAACRQGQHLRFFVGIHSVANFRCETDCDERGCFLCRQSLEWRHLQLNALIEFQVVLDQKK